MLNKAEANLAAVNRLSEEVIAQKEELHRKASMELESVKLKVSKYPTFSSFIYAFFIGSLLKRRRKYTPYEPSWQKS